MRLTVSLTSLLQFRILLIWRQFRFFTHRGLMGQRRPSEDSKTQSLCRRLVDMHGPPTIPNGPMHAFILAFAPELQGGGHGAQLVVLQSRESTTSHFQRTCILVADGKIASFSRYPQESHVEGSIIRNQWQIDSERQELVQGAVQR